MARPSIDNLRSVGDFATTVNWDVQFIKLPGSLNSYLREDLNIQCESMDVPKNSGTSTEIWVRGHRTKQPGLWTPSGTITLSMNETVDTFIRGFIKDWRELCWETQTGRQTAKADLEAEIMLFQLDRSDDPVWQYHLIGVYLEDYDPGGQMQAQSADIIKPTLTLSYDYFIEKSFDGNQPSRGGTRYSQQSFTE